MAASVIVFGGSRGMGRQLTEHFLGKGWLVSVAARATKGLHALRQESGATAGHLNTTQADVADEDAVRLRLVETVSQELRLAGYSGVIINAIAPGPVRTDMTDEILRNARKTGAKKAAAAEEVRQSGGTPPALIVSLVDFLCDRSSNRGVSGRLFHVKDDYAGFASQGDRGHFPEDAGRLRGTPLP